MIIKYALAQLFHQKKFILIFSLTLSLGLSGFLTVYHLKYALMNTISSRAKAMMGGDLKISSRQVFTQQELEIIDAILPQPHRLSQSVSLFSMLRDTQGHSRLVSLRAIDNTFPLYGDIKRTPFNADGHGEQKRQDKKQRELWLSADLQSQMEFNPDDILFLGQASFVPTALVANEQANFSEGFAPRVYIKKEDLKDTQLMQSDSLFWIERLYAFSDISLDQIKKLRSELSRQLDRPGINIASYASANRQTNRLIDYLSDFLGLVALSAFMLSGLGCYFLIRTYFQTQYRSMGTLMSLGMRPAKALSIYLIQTMVLSTCATLLALITAHLFLPLLSKGLQNLSSAQIPLTLSPETMAMAWLLALGQCLFIAAPLLILLKRLPIRAWLDHTVQDLKSSWSLTLLSFAPLSLFYFFIAIWIANSWINGSLFVGLLMFCLLLSFALFKGLSHLLKRVSPSSDVSLYLALTSIQRKPFSHALIFISLSLALSLIQTIPQIENSLKQNLSQGKAQKLPSLFLFDIQDDQVENLKTFITEQDLKFSKILPMVRARLKQLNGQVFTKSDADEIPNSREAERTARFRNRGFNLTYQKELSPSERLYSGQPFNGVYSGEGLAEISIEKRFAQRLGFKLGDQLSFAIQGILVEGKIVNLKTVDWTSFEPNFFVSFQEGVLENAPKTYLATLSQLPQADKNQLQNSLAQHFPNISIIDIEALARELQKILSEMAKALSLMSFLSLLVGGVVIFAIIRHQGTQHAWELALKKSLGMRRKDIQRQYFYQFGLLVFFAIMISFVLSFSISFVICRYVFEGINAFNWYYPLWSYPLLASLIFATIMLATHQYFSIKANLLLGTKN